MALYRYMYTPMYNVEQNLVRNYLWFGESEHKSPKIVSNCACVLVLAVHICTYKACLEARLHVGYCQN